MVGLWVAVVVACASLTWLVISRAGRDVGVTQVALTTSESSTAAPTAVRPTAPSPSQSESEPTSAAPTTSRTTAPSSGASPRTTAPPAPSPRNSTPPVSAPPVNRATFSTLGGTVTAACAGSTIRLDSATPRDGYRLHQEISGGILEVSFTSGTGGDGEGSDDGYGLHIVCQGGIPVQHS